MVQKILSQQRCNDLVVVWNANKGKSVQAFSSYRVHWNHNSQAILTANKGETADQLILWDLRTGRKLRTIKTPNSRIHDFTWYPDDNCVATINDLQSNQIWDVRTGIKLMSLQNKCIG
ncbi:hypothetical protein CMK12_05655 [Candidatus Poribacteria bacterium]|nr:hypothetical protein [Candidatus Poribacteria bacterium]